MWISKEKLDALEHRIKRLEERDTMPRMVIPRAEGSLIYWPYGGPDTVPVVDVVQKIVDHLGLSISRTPEKLSTVELKKKVEPWAGCFDRLFRPAPKPQKTSKRKRGGGS